MHQKLKRKFVLMCASLTGIVLLAACLFAFGNAKTEIERRYAEAFENQSQSLSVFLAGTRQLHYNQFYQMEQDGGTHVYFYDSGAAIYNAESHAEDRDAVYAALVGALVKAYPELTPNGINLDAPVNETFTFECDGEPYLGKYVSTPTGNRQWYSYALARPVAGQLKEIQALAIQYIAIYAAGFSLLFLIAWALARLAVKPVEAAHQKQTEFIAAASHELKSPLAVMRAAADFAKEDAGSAFAALDKVTAETARMSALVDDLLLLAGSENTRWRMQKAPVNIENTLLIVYENYMPLAKSKGQTLRLLLPEAELAEIMADEYRMIQLVSALVSNAIVYSPKDSGVEIIADATKKQLVIRVADHGPGIADGEKERVFEAFYRSDKSRSGKSHFGLGLSVAKQLAELHNGTIKVLDTPGGGATFVVTLPI